ncbi:Tetratricopeptide repeat-containing protein [Alteromonadaceae bacterium Bs31]|nr:Tetratricopeptide repeat-containing protein [Alteromonadaceae bacterium Bs31]
MRFKKNVVAIFLITSLISILSACSRDSGNAQDFVASGDRYYAAGDIEAAALEYNNALRVDEKSVDALMGLVNVLERKKRWGRLERYLKRALEIAPDYTPAKIRLAYLHIATGRLDSAMEISQQLSASSPDELGVKLVNAAVFLQIGEREKAIEILRDVKSTNPENIDATVLLASDAIQNERFSEALEILDQGLQQNPESQLLSLIQVDVLSKAGKVEEVVSVIERLIKLYPESESYPEALAQHYLHRGEAQRALATLEQAVTRIESEVLLFSIIDILYSQEGGDVAEARLRAYIQQYPGLPELQFALVDILLNSDRQAEAQKELDSIIAAGKDNNALRIKGLNKKARIHVSLGEATVAERIVDQVLALDGSDASSLATKASLLLARGETADAVKALRLGLRRQPDSAELLLGLAKAHEMEEQLQLAREYYQRALDAVPMEAGSNRNKVLLSYALFMEKQGNYTRARDLIKPAVAQGTASEQMLKIYARINLRLGDWKEAERSADILADSGSKADVVAHIRSLSNIGKKDADAAISSLHEFYSAAPDAFRPMAMLVNTYLSIGKVLEAKLFVNNILTANPNNIYAYMLKGSISSYERDWSGAESAYRRVLALEPGNKKGHEALISTLLRAGKLEKAKLASLTARKAFPEDVVVAVLHATVEERVGDSDAAIAIYELLYEQDPELDVVVNNLAALLHRKGGAQNIDRAGKLAERFSDTNVPHFADTLGWIYVSQEKFDKAIALLTKADKGLPGNVEIRYHLAKALHGAGWGQRAKDTLDTVADQLDGLSASWAEDARKLHSSL